MTVILKKKHINIFEKASVASPKPPKGVNPSSPAKDDESMEVQDGDTERDLSGRYLLWIRYVDTKKDFSERAIKILSVKNGPNGLMIYAFCYERHAMRSFRADRIEEMWWPDTGEVIKNPVSFFNEFQKITSIDDLIKEYWPGLVVLAFLARCDGFFDEKEAKIMADYIEEQYEEALSQQELANNRNEIVKRIRSIYPDVDEANKGANNILKWPRPKRRDLCRYIRNLCDADGILQDEEAKWALEFANIIDSQ